MLARSKFNSMESKISQALRNIINEKRNYRELKENIRIMKSQRKDTEKIEKGKKQPLMKLLNTMKLSITESHKYKTMPSTLHNKFKVQKNTENINAKVLKTNNGKTMLLSKCAICCSKNSRFIKKQEVKGILSSLGLKTPLNKIPLLSDILF